MTTQKRNPERMTTQEILKESEGWLDELIYERDSCVAKLRLLEKRMENPKYMASLELRQTVFMVHQRRTLKNYIDVIGKRIQMAERNGLD